MGSDKKVSYELPEMRDCTDSMMRLQANPLNHTEDTAAVTIFQETIDTNYQATTSTYFRL